MQKHFTHVFKAAQFLKCQSFGRLLDRYLHGASSDTVDQRRVFWKIVSLIGPHHGRRAESEQHILTVRVKQALFLYGLGDSLNGKAETLVKIDILVPRKKNKHTSVDIYVYFFFLGLCY